LRPSTCCKILVMNKLFFTFPFLFLFFQKINGQTRPRLVKKVTQIYSDSLNQYVDEKHELFEYDDKGNENAHTTIEYDKDGEVNSWKKMVFSYNVNNLLEKETLRRFNWNLGLWVSLSSVEYYYDNNQCLIERRQIPQLASENSFREMLEIDQNCLEIATILTEVQPDTTIFAGVSTYEYDDRGNMINAEIERYFTIFDTLTRIIEQEFNDQNDLKSRLTYLESPSIPFFIGYDNQWFEYDYQFTNAGEILKKEEKIHKIYETSIDTILSQIIETEYFYTCEGLISFEEKSSTELMLGEIELEKRKIFYHYQGEDPCFDYENKSRLFVYPNPTYSEVNIESPLLESGNSTIQIIDLNGKVLLEKKTSLRENTQAIDVRYLNEGIYTLRVYSESYFVSEKLVIVN